jgi:hypothetical protein
MLRISVQFPGDAVSIRMEGRLADQWAEELKNLVLNIMKAHGSTVQFEVNLADVTCAGSSGENVLKWLSQLGTHFVVESVSSRWLCERFGLVYDTVAVKSGRAQLILAACPAGRKSAVLLSWRAGYSSRLAGAGSGRGADHGGRRQGPAF